MSRFDYVKYDETAQHQQGVMKAAFQELENLIDALTCQEKTRPTSIAHTKLEEAYMWIGKAIRDEQIHRNSKTALQEERTNS